MRTLHLPNLEDSLRILEMVWTRLENAGGDEKSEVSVTSITEVMIPEPPAANVVEFNRLFRKLRVLGIDCLH